MNRQVSTFKKIKRWFGHPVDKKACNSLPNIRNDTNDVLNAHCTAKELYFCAISAWVFDTYDKRQRQSQIFPFPLTDREHLLD